MTTLSYTARWDTTEVTEVQVRMHEWSDLLTPVSGCSYCANQARTANFRATNDT